jgi:hypothetical protein
MYAHLFVSWPLGVLAAGMGGKLGPKICHKTVMIGRHEIETIHLTSTGQGAT